MIAEGLLSVMANNGSLLHLGVLLGEERPPETNVPAGATLAFWHDESPSFGRDNPQPIPGRIGAVWPVMVSGDSYIVVAGEVQDDAITGALVRFSEPGEPAYAEQMVQVHQVLGRRVWMSHPVQMHRKDQIWVVWLHGEPESITVDPSWGSGDDHSTACTGSWSRLGSQAARRGDSTVVSIQPRWEPRLERVVGPSTTSGSSSAGWRSCTSPIMRAPTRKRGFAADRLFQATRYTVRCCR